MWIQNGKKGVIYGDPGLQKEMCTVIEINPVTIAQSAVCPRLHQERKSLLRPLAEALLDSKENLWREVLSWRQASKDAFYPSQIKALPLQKINAMFGGYSPGRSLSKSGPKDNSRSKPG